MIQSSILLDTTLNNLKEQTTWILLTSTGEHDQRKSLSLIRDKSINHNDSIKRGFWHWNIRKSVPKESKQIKSRFFSWKPNIQSICLVSRLVHGSLPTYLHIFRLCYLFLRASHFSFCKDKKRHVNFSFAYRMPATYHRPTENKIMGILKGKCFLSLFFIVTREWTP